MKLNISFSDLNIAASQMNGIRALAHELESQKVSNEQGQNKLREFVTANNGDIQGLTFSANGESVRVLGTENFKVNHDES